MAAIDMTNWIMSEHGIPDSKWTVLKRAKSNTTEAKWLCECSCENKTQKILAGSDLRRGKTKSCGCFRKDYMAKNKTKYNIGDIFGDLTILKDSGKRNSSGSIIYICKCTCGNNNYEIPSEDLTKRIKNNELHCGSSIHQVKDITGMTFGNLIPVKIDKNSLGINSGVKWLCKCIKCNREDLVSIRSHDLISGKSSSCGCGHSISKGASKILNILNNIQGIIIRSELTFDDLKNPNTNSKLRYDFGIYKNDILQYIIEYDGEQHFYYQDSPNSWNTKDEFIDRKKRDEIKNKYCINNNIKLYRIPYYDIDNINFISDILQNKYLIS